MFPLCERAAVPFRFVHTADLHLDSPLRSLALRDPDLATLIGAATRAAFSAVIDLCLAERADALLIAGDLYDGDQTSMKTARFLADELGRLEAAGVRSFIIRGNHDALSRITRELTLPPGATVFGARAETHEIAAPGGLRVAVHGLSFARPQAPDTLLPRYRPPVEGAVNVGLMHTSLNGAPDHDLYAPCPLADLQASGFRYWALGHIHSRSAWPGPCAVVMPGMPQGRDVNEAGAKTATLVHVADDGAMTLAEHVVGLAQFERVTVRADGVQDWRALVERVEAGLAAARGAAASEHLVARVTLRGATPLAWRMRRDADLLTEDARRRAPRDVWIERLDVEAAPPAAAADASPGPGFAELRALVEAAPLADPALRAEAREMVRGLQAALPRELRDMLGGDPDAVDATLDALAAEGVAETLAHLRESEDAGAEAD